MINVTKQIEKYKHHIIWCNICFLREFRIISLRHKLLPCLRLSWFACSTSNKSFADHMLGNSVSSQTRTPQRPVVMFNTHILERNSLSVAWKDKENDNGEGYLQNLTLHMHLAKSIDKSMLGFKRRPELFVFTYSTSYAVSRNL